MNGGADEFGRLASLLARDRLEEEARALGSLLRGRPWTPGTELPGALGEETTRIRKSRRGAVGAETQYAWRRCAAGGRTAWPLLGLW